MHKKTDLGKLAIALLLLPLIFIAVLLVGYFRQNVALDGTDKVGVTLVDGKSYTYTERDDIEYYCSLLVDAKRIDSPVRDIKSETPITVTYVRGTEKQVYRLYPTRNASGCMMYDEKDHIYLLNEHIATDYLCRAECLYLYGDIMLPKLQIISGNSVTDAYPDSYTWSYRKADGAYYADRTSPTYDGKTLHFYDGRANSLSFTIKPDEIYDVSFTTADGAILPVSGIETLVFDDDTVITVSLKAKWTRNDAHEYFGEAEYTLTMLYDVPATVTLSRESVSAGGLVVISIDHLSEDDSISFGTDIKTSTIVHYKDENTGKYFAFLPVASDCPAGMYDINFELNGSIQTVKLLVNETVGETLPLLETPDEFSAMLSPEVIGGLHDSFASVTSARSDTAYFTLGDKFGSAVTGTKVASFADVAVVSGSGAIYRLPGNIYSVKSGASVKAMQRGEVVFAQATATTGNTVIISHGYGIYSYYFNLSSVTCNVGDIMTQGQIMGQSGNSGYTWTFDDITHCAVSVGGVFVDPSLFTGGSYYR